MSKLKLEVGQKWISETHPHEDFEIYYGIGDTFLYYEMNIQYNTEFEKLPEIAKIYFWKRVNEEAFHQFVISKKGENYASTYPYAWAGECKGVSIRNKIKKYNMKLLGIDLSV